MYGIVLTNSFRLLGTANHKSNVLTTTLSRTGEMRTIQVQPIHNTHVHRPTSKTLNIIGYVGFAKGPYSRLNPPIPGS